MASDAIRQELNRMKLDELRVLSRELGLRGVSSASKPELLQQLLQVDDAMLEATLHATGPSHSGMHYQPALWEKITSASVAVGIVILVAYLAIQNKAIDSTVAQFVRILISLAVSVIGATIPGFLSVGLSARGLLVRAGGALALFVLTYFFSPQVVPNIQPAVTFALRDVSTRQRIDRPFKVEYRVDGPVMRQDCSGGLCPITARSAKDVEILAVICDGYSLDSRDDRTLYLKRVEPDESDEMVDDEFLVAITPEKNPYDYDTVSRATYEATTSREVPPEEVVFTVVNQTDDFLDILYHHYTQGQEDAFEGWGRLPPCAPGQSVSKSSFGKQSGYYFIFGSRFGRKAEFLGQRNLYLTRTPKLYVSDANGSLQPAWEDAPLAAR